MKFVILTLILCIANAASAGIPETLQHQEELIATLNSQLLTKPCLVELDKQMAFDLAITSGKSVEEAKEISYGYFNQMQFDMAISAGASVEFANEYASKIFSEEFCTDL